MPDGELQHLAARAEVAPIFRTHGGLVRSREGKELQSELRELARRGVVALGEVAVKTDVTKVVMDSVTEIDAYRRALAGGDEVLNQILAQVELTHTRSLAVTQRKLDGGIV